MNRCRPHFCEIQQNMHHLFNAIPSESVDLCTFPKCVFSIFNFQFAISIFTCFRRQRYHPVSLEISRRRIWYKISDTWANLGDIRKSSRRVKVKDRELVLLIGNTQIEHNWMHRLTLRLPAPNKCQESRNTSASRPGNQIRYPPEIPFSIPQN